MEILHNLLVHQAKYFKLMSSQQDGGMQLLATIERTSQSLLSSRRAKQSKRRRHIVSR